MNELIGLPFKRNVHGLSLWTDIIAEVRIIWKVPGSLMRYAGHQIPTIQVKGDKHWFELNEIVVVRPLDFGQKLRRNKEELHTIIQEEWTNRQKYKQESLIRPLNSTKKDDLAT